MPAVRKPKSRLRECDITRDNSQPTLYRPEKGILPHKTRRFVHADHHHLVYTSIEVRGLRSESRSKSIDLATDKMPESNKGTRLKGNCR